MPPVSTSSWRPTTPAGCTRNWLPGPTIRLLAPEHRADAVRLLLEELDAGAHALPSDGDHERVRHASATAGWWVALGLLAAVTIVVGLRVSAFVG